MSENLNFDFEEMEINDTVFPLDVKKTSQIIVTKNFDGDIKYSSSNEKVATVSKDGLITKIAKGKATITVTCGSRSVTCEVVDLISKNSNVLPLLNIPYLHSRGITGKGVKVALMETFIKNSEEISIKGWYDAVHDKYYSSQPSSIKGVSTENHSYHMASLIKGKERGAAPDCEFYNVIVEGETDFEIAVERCVDWCIKNNIKVISDSIAVSYEKNLKKLHNIYKKAYDHGIIITQAIGNCYKGESEYADENGYLLNKFSINLGACESNGEHNTKTCHGRPMMFNNYGFSGLKAWNPTSKYNATTDKTSAASALTAGCTALLLQQDPSLTPRQIYHIFKDNAKQNSSYKQGEWNEMFGWGRISVPVLANIKYKTDAECINEDNAAKIIDLYLANAKNKNGQYEIAKDNVLLCIPVVSPVIKDEYDITVEILTDNGVFYRPDIYKNAVMCKEKGELRLLLRIKELGMLKEVKVNVI